MSLTQYSGNTSYITNTGTTVEERGLTTDQFKALFDQGLKDWVTWFNGSHLKEIPVPYDDTGTANALIITPSPVFTAYTSTMVFFVKVANTNTGAATININALGPKPIVKYGATTLVAGDLIAGSYVLIKYDGTNFQLIGETSAGTQAKVNAIFSSGTWTPVLSGSTTPGAHTYTTQIGNYYKIGKLVYLYGAVVISSKDGTMAGPCRIIGLPFPAAYESAASMIYYQFIDLQNASTKDLTARIATSAILFYENLENGSAINLSSAAIQNSSELRFSGVYVTS